jgi:M6 family metalloprotease-like protein
MQSHPWMGQQRALVLLLEWPNVAANVHPGKIESTMFEPNAPSLRQYFLENSVGNFDLTGKVLTWKKASVNWQNDLECRPTDVAAIAWETFKDQVNIADYDSDHDGKIDHLFVIHSARGETDRVGPDCVFGRHASAEEAIVFQSEGMGPEGEEVSIGFYIHEAGHEYFNFPDLYADHYHGRYGIGMWGVMGLGAWGVSNEIPRPGVFRMPAHFEPLSKALIGWIKPMVIEKSVTNVKLRPVEATGDVVAIPIGSKSAYYLEYRSKRGFSTGHLGHGLLIWKDYAIIQADGRDDINHGNNLGHRPLPPISENFGDASDPFPGSLGVTEFTDAKSGVRITNIKQTDELITFDVEVKSGFRPESIRRLPLLPRNRQWRERL